MLEKGKNDAAIVNASVELILCQVSFFLRGLRVITHVILRTALCRRYHCYTSFQIRKRGTKRFSNLSEFVQLVNYIVEMQTQAVWLRSLCSITGLWGTRGHMCLTKLTRGCWLRVPTRRVIANPEPREAFWGRNALSCTGRSDLFTEAHTSASHVGSR